MANYYDRNPATIGYFGAMVNAGRTGLALDSAYTYNSAGDCIAMRFVSPVTSNLTTVYAFMSAHAGTPGNLTCELRNYSAADTPGSTLHASQTASPGTTDNKWVTFTFGSPFECQRGVTYFVVIGDAAGSGTDYATMLYAAGPFAYDARRAQFSYRSTDGFASVKTENNSFPVNVLKFADGTIIGNPYTSTWTVHTSNQLMRGLRIAGLTEKLVISGVLLYNGTTSVSGLKIFSGSAAPGDSADLTVTFGAGAATVGAAYFAPFTLEKATVYRIVCTYSGNATAPSYLQNQDSSVADTISCGFGGGTIYHTISDGGTPAAWTDGTDKWPGMALLIQDQVAITGGGGGPLIGGRLVRG